MRATFILTGFLLAACGIGAERPDSPRLDPDLPYQARKSDPVTYEVDFSAVVTAPQGTKVLKVWLPLPQSDSAQEVTAGDLTCFPMKVKPIVGKEKRFGNQFAYFEYKNPQGAQIIRHRFTVKVWELNWNVDLAKVQTVEQWPASFARYRQGDATIQVDDPLRDVLAKVLPQRQAPGHDLMIVLDWVHANLTYDHVDASLKASSRHALEKRHGHCSDYHGLCAAFGRAMGFPTRITYGINPFPKNSPSHCKIEVYLPPYGWVSFDVAETQQLIHAIEKNGELSATRKAKLVKAARDRMLRGFRDNTWYLQTRGTDYDLAPPATKRVPVVRTIYAEADGVALPEPDPGAKGKKEFAWMTVHDYKGDRQVPYPFKDYKTLEKE